MKKYAHIISNSGIDFICEHINGITWKILLVKNITPKIFSIENQPNRWKQVDLLIDLGEYDHNVMKKTSDKIEDLIEDFVEDLL